jgi:hypothetical protein
MQAKVNITPDPEDRRIVRLTTAPEPPVTVGVSGRDGSNEPSLAVEVTVGGPPGPVRLVPARDATDASDIEAARWAEEDAALAAADVLALAEETNDLRP